MREAPLPMETNGPTGKDSAAAQEEEEPKKYGVKYLEERYNKGGDKKISDKPKSDSDSSSQETSDYNEYPLVSIQVFDEDDKPEKKRLRINSSHLCEALSRAVQFYPDQPASYDPPVEIESPFAIIHHHLSELRDCRDDSTTQEERDHFNYLFEFLDKESSSSGAAAAGLVKNGLITFKLLWAIFKPGDYLHITDAGGQPQILWLQRASQKRDYRRRQDYLSLDCLYTASDGTKVGKTEREAKVYQDEFPANGPRQITSLSTFPIKHLEDNERVAVTTRVAARAAEYNELESHKKGGVLRRYNGIFEFLVESPGFGPEWEPHTTVGRIIIDTKAFMEENPSKKILVTAWGDDDNSKTTSTDSSNSITNTNKKDMPTERDILYPPYIYGYCLSMRKWGRFYLGRFSEPGFDDKLWDNHLILPPTQRELLHSMVSSHLFPSETDIHEEEALKGKGLVIVLHGPPGTGKTLTAVAIAEKTEKPLLLYPAGELGSRLETIQSSIKKIIRQASRWEAILLIDEADVFLESREGPSAAGVGGSANLERNALVAVFLRQLEYSQSIIFLTSNRAQMFDPAIKSRVHLSLHYPTPGAATRRLLWEDKFSEYPQDKLHVDLHDRARALDLVARYALNGREISNIFNSAMTLAMSDRNKKLRMEHLENVLRVWEESEDQSAGRAREMVFLLKSVVDHGLRGLGLLVLLGLAVIISLHGYQVVFKGNRDVLILYR